MEYNIKRVEHVWCESDDRWVYIEYNEDNKIIGLNFMQGDEYELFKKQWDKCDDGLTDYYTQMLDIFKIEKQSSSNLGFINKVMWSYHVAQVNSYDINTEVPRDLKQETISELAQVAKEATIEVLHDTVDHVISESDVPLVDYDLHSEVMDATMLLLVQEGLQL